MDIVIVGEAKDGREAMSLIEKVEPDLVILDISMPTLSGLEITRQILKKGLNTKFIILTMHKDIMLANKAIKCGAHGYILKDNALKDLIYAIKTVIEGGEFISPSISKEILTIQNGDKGQKTDLTNREKEIVGLIASGLTNKRIAKSSIYSKTHTNSIPHLKYGQLLKFKRKDIDIWLRNPYSLELESYNLNFNGRKGVKKK